MDLNIKLEVIRLCEVGISSKSGVGRWYGSTSTLFCGVEEQR
jgi:hypothetical protein